MTKRLCPFEENYAPQLKTRITEKRGTLKSMENVWNKTRDLLFQAAKKTSKKSINHAGCNGCQEYQNCELCEFCSKRFCCDCSGRCTHCGGFFCTDCSTLVYEADSTEYACLSCIT